MTDLEVLRAALAAIGAPCEEDCDHLCTDLPKGDPDDGEYTSVHAVIFRESYLCFDQDTGRYLGLQIVGWASWTPRAHASGWHQFGEVNPIKK